MRIVVDVESKMWTTKWVLLFNYSDKSLLDVQEEQKDYMNLNKQVFHETSPINDWKTFVYSFTQMLSWDRKLYQARWDLDVWVWLQDKIIYVTI